MRLSRATLLLLTCALGAAPASFAAMWGEEGHRTVCEIAVRRLTSEAQALVSELLAPEQQTLPGICTWADSARTTTHRETAPYHYINLPRDAKSVDLSRDCADVEKRCVIWAIQNYGRILNDKTKPAAERREALKFVAHFVGDLHQPLHVSYADDLGGNQTRVTFFGDAGRPERPPDLHSVWDNRILMRAGAQSRDWALRLDSAIASEDATRWQTLDVVAWAIESYDATVTLVYGKLPADRRIEDEYYQPALKLSETQLQKGGVRLAFVLNRAAAGGLTFP